MRRTGNEDALDLSVHNGIESFPPPAGWVTIAPPIHPHLVSDLHSIGVPGDQPVGHRNNRFG